MPTPRPSKSPARATSPALRRAQALARGVPYLIPRETGGRVRFYWQPGSGLAAAGWTAQPLGTDPAAAVAAAMARNAEVETWRMGGARPVEVARRTVRHTVSAMIDRYKAEHLASPDISANWRRTCTSQLAAIEELFGDWRVDEVTHADVLNWKDRLLGRGKWLAAGPIMGDHATHNHLRTGRALWNWAKAPHRALAEINPFDKFEMAMPKGRRQVWEAQDEALFIAAARDIGLPSMALAMELAIYTGQRSDDLVKMTEAQLAEPHLADPALHRFFAGQDGRVLAWHVTQAKTETPLIIPIEPKLMVSVASAIRTNRAKARARGELDTHVLIDDRTGRPWTPRAFIRAWNEVLAHIIKNTGRDDMAGLQWRDLRRTRVVRLRRRGFSREMIGAITGHSPKSIDAMLAVYGPIDPTITAHALAAAAAPPQAPAKARPQRKRA